MAADLSLVSPAPAFTAQRAGVTGNPTAKLPAKPLASQPLNGKSSWTPPPPDYTATGQALARAGTGDYFSWLNHVSAAAGCSRPIRLSGIVATIEPATGRLLSERHTDDMPDAAIYKVCGNRRHSICPSCAATYQADAFQLLRSGLVGGKGVPDTVARHPAVFATFTAPSFGPVHTRHVKRHTCRDRRRCDCRPEPCHARRSTSACEHDVTPVCWKRHDPDDPQLGQPFCLDCYDHQHQAVWNLFTGKLWHRTTQNALRYLKRLCRQRGIPGHRVIGPNGSPRTIAPIRLSHGKAAEMQRRGAVHFHALVRLDGIDPHDPDAVAPPPAGLTVDDLIAALHHAGTVTTETAPPHPDQPDGWPIAWGDPDKGLDLRPLRLSGTGDVSDAQAAAYLAKYATKGTEATGYQSTRITADTEDRINPVGGHTDRLIAACWQLGRPIRKPTQRQGNLDTPPAITADASPYARLRRWAHMLGFGGHFLTKARRYSTTFGALRAARITYRRTTELDHNTHDAGPLDADSNGDALTVGILGFAGVGWHTLGDALLANTAAAMARERRNTGREELAHERGSPFRDLPAQAA
ncbi:replication initiator [Actinoplanes sp. HUAS TT8]|uniref:replication initiator n=1 Tax=Actinoplanes sp. HUAS TT8 TaxID=3447453 RepID=UPI003F51F918